MQTTVMTMKKKTFRESADPSGTPTNLTPSESGLDGTMDAAIPPLLLTVSKKAKNPVKLLVGSLLILNALHSEAITKKKKRKKKTNSSDAEKLGKATSHTTGVTGSNTEPKTAAILPPKLEELKLVFNPEKLLTG